MWHLGGRKNEIGDFYLFLAHLLDPCRYLQPVQLVGKFQKGWEKNWGGNHTEEDNEKGFNMSRNNILLRRLPNPKRVQLSSGGVFFAKYERVNRHELAPIHIRINRTEKNTGPRNKFKKRGGVGAGLHLATAID